MEVEYTELPGWETSTTGVKRWDDLPANAQRYVEFVEKYVGVKVGWVGTGVGRDDMGGQVAAATAAPEGIDI